MNTIEYKLRLLLNSYTIKILNMVDLTDSKKMLDFNALYCDTKKIQAFCKEIGGMTKFPMLNVPLTENSNIHKVYFCEVAVGNSIFVSHDYADSLDIPTGIDSLITDETNTINYITDKSIDIKTCSYIIKDSRKILPLYEITFEYDEEFEKRSRGKNICHRCKETEAIVFCPSERANFCEDCDNIIHSDPFLCRHERLYFTKVGQKKFICCLYHPTKIVDYFCEECAEPICSECQIEGKHSTKEFRGHKISAFLDACKSAGKSVKSNNPVIESYIETVNSYMSNVVESVNSFRESVGYARKHIEREIKKLMHQLEVIESNHRQFYNALYVEQLHKKEMFKQMINYPSELDPADILIGYKNIIAQMKEEHNLVSPTIETDKIEVQGKMTIKTPKDEKSNLQKSTKAEDIAVGWRVETMNLVGRS